jgi:sulfur relay (sulfurtransferase) DsrC/TusE family protein
MTRREPPYVRHITYYDKTYRVDIYGYLLDPEEWTERFARRKADEMGVGRLTSHHWDTLGSLRGIFSETGEIPAVPEVCQAAGIGAEEFERLFPLGYLRCAVKLAGLNPVKRAASP